MRPGRSPRSATAAAALLTAAALFLALAPRAEAGSYSVAECMQNVNPYSPDQFFYNNSPDSQPGYQGRDSNCAHNEWGGAQDGDVSGVAPYLGAAAWELGGMIWQVPYGTKITWATVEARLRPLDGHQTAAYFENADASAQSMLHYGDTGGMRTLSGGANHDRFVVRMHCERASCTNWTYAVAAVRNLRFVLNDWATPWINGWGGSLLGGGWLRGGGHSLAVNGFDYGSGVQYFYVYANGQLLTSQELACEQQREGYYPRFSPCYGGQTRGASWGGISTQQGGLRDGANTLTACAVDLAVTGGANWGCDSRTVYIDNVAPPSPEGGLGLAGTSDWRPSNDFDVSWQSPAQPGAQAPLAATHYRIVGPGGYDTGDRRIGLTSSLDNLSVPGAGEYELSVWLEDAAGNQDAATAKSVRLRFDDTVPPVSEAASEGWLRRNDFPHVLSWSRPDPGALGPSGLQGYAVAIDDSPGTDPCMSDGEPSCSAEEIDHAGGAGDSGEVLEDYPGGAGHWVHVVAVSGAGVRAPAVGHTRMPVDKRDPETRIAGVPGDWVNRDVELTVTATDALSGMLPDAAGFPDDPQPRTVLQLDGGPEQAEAGGSASATISAEGEHTVHWWARDLAGNANDGQAEGPFQNEPPGTATVRIDKTPPQVAFQDAESPDDPTLIVAQAGDGLSGVVSGRIWIRRMSGGDWEPLPTELEGGRLEARFPDDVPDGRYELMAQATDRAGNVTRSDTRANGTPMVVDAPLKTVTELVGGLGGEGVRDVTVGYGRPAEVTGVLRTETGAPLGGTELTVSESFGPGSREAQAARTVRTDEQGRFSVPLSGGPTRQVRVSYEGSRRYFSSDLSGLEMKVHGAVLSFRAPRSVSEDERLVFHGRIGALGVFLGKLGKLIELQYLKSPGEWKTIDTGRARGEGRFRIAYALRNDYARPARVVFRVRVPKERKWPYIGGAHSRARATTIRPK